MQKSARCVFSASPWSSENTMRAIFAVSHHKPAPKYLVVEKLIRWLRSNAVWDRCHYTDNALPPGVRLEAYTAPWSPDFHLLLHLAVSGAPPVCV